MDLSKYRFHVMMKLFSALFITSRGN